MLTEDETASLIDRYLRELDTYLPRDLRAGVEAELRQKLDKALATQLEADPSLAPRDAEIEVLRELGPPHQVADEFVPRPRVLFGPRLYPPFLRTIKIAIACLVALAAIGVFLDFARSESLWTLGPAFLAALGIVLKGSLVAIGIAVVVFAVIERTATHADATAKDWDPRTLVDLEDPDKIALGDQISSIAFLIFALIVVNFFRDRIGAHVTWEGESGWVPLLGPAFDRQLWLLNLALALELLIHFIALLRWRWSWTLRWANFLVHGLYVVWLGLLVLNPPLIAADPDWMVRNGWSVAAAQEYSDFIASSFARHINLNLKLGFWAACAGLTYSLFKLIRRQLTGR